jgi:hypothetical protein
LQTIAIAREALSTMIASSGVNETYRMYLLAKRDGIDFNLAPIGDDFDVPYTRVRLTKNTCRRFLPTGIKKAALDSGRKLRQVMSWKRAPPGVRLVSALM